MSQEFKSFKDEINSIPLVDEDVSEQKNEESEESDQKTDNKLPSTESKNEQLYFSKAVNSYDFSNSHDYSDLSTEEIEEKKKLIQQVFELQNTLDDLSLRVDTVKEENLKLKSENQILGQYIENLMSASSVFQSTSSNVKMKHKT